MTRLRILVIDDDPLFRSLLTSMLRKDFQVTVAGEGAEGFYKALQNPPHLVIVDFRMPGWDGVRTIKSFRSHNALSHIPLVMLTSDASRQTVMSAMQAGANEYIIKTTLTHEDLRAKVCGQLGIEPSCAFANGDEPELAAIAVSPSGFPGAAKHCTAAEIPQLTKGWPALLPSEESFLHPMIEEMIHRD